MNNNQKIDIMNYLSFLIISILSIFTMCDTVDSIPDDISYLWSEAKHIHDSIHGYIPLTQFAMRIVDTHKFQRLRGLKQLGTCNYVFPDGGVHTRFEHSLGTYYLALQLLTHIVANSDPNDVDEYLANIPELKNYYDRMYSGKIHILDDYVIELCKIAALCHDIGHGPFSHVFDDVFLPTTDKRDHENASHETRSGLLLELIIKEDPILSHYVTDDEIAFMKTLINPTHEHNGFIYQIVSNTLNGLDVDKYDYLIRDTTAIYGKSKFDHTRLTTHIKIIGNNIVYPEQASWDILDLFQARHRMHRQVYCHKGVIAAQYLIIELFFALDPILNISSSILDMNEFCKLDDEYILQSVKFLSLPFCHLSADLMSNLERAKNIIDRLHTHQFYAFVDSHVSTSKLDLSDFVTMTGNDSNLVIYQSKVGFVSGNKTNPLDNVYVYKTKDTGKYLKIEAIKKNKEDITALMPKTHQEHVIMVFYKNKSDIVRINDIKRSFNDYTKCHL